MYNKKYTFKIQKKYESSSMKINSCCKTRDQTKRREYIIAGNGTK